MTTKHTVVFYTKDTNGNIVNIGSNAPADNQTFTHVHAMSLLRLAVSKYIRETEQLDGTQARTDAYAVVYCYGIQSDFVKLAERANGGKCLYDMWIDGEIGNFGSFTTSLLQAFMNADGGNRRKLATAFPEYFAGSTFL